jgi:hypothetical protein
MLIYFTAMKVILLDFFEKLTRGFHDAASETRHLEGAMALVKLRGEEQFSNPLRLRMFLKLSLLILQNCLQRNIAPPEDFVLLREKSRRFMDEKDPRWRWGELCLGIGRLRGDLKMGRVVGVKERLEGMEREYNEVGVIMCKLDGKEITLVDEPVNSGIVRLRTSLLVVRGYLDEILREFEERMARRDLDSCLDTQAQAIPDFSKS